MKLKYLFFSLIFCWLSSSGQTIETISKDLKFKRFTSADGLSQRSVMAILQDKKGYLWFGTRDGLNKFDGNKFIVYRHNANDPRSLSNNNIHAIYEDSYGNLWIGTQVGLNRYDPQTDRFIHYKHSDGNDDLTDHLVRSILQINSDTLWAATDNGILQVNIKTQKTERIRKENSRRINFLSHNSTRFLLKAKDESIWICNTQYIDVYNPGKKTFKRINYPRQNLNSNNIHFNDLPTLFADRKNAIWLGYEQGLALYNPQTESFSDLEQDDKPAVKTAVRSICEDLAGNLWIGSYSGLYILNSEHTHLEHIVHNENDATSLSQNSIYKIIRDSRGDMWIGTWADGLNYYNKDIGVFKSISFGNTNNKLNYKVVSGITEDDQGNLWIGTEGGGLNFYNSATRKFTYFKNEPDNKSSLSANNVKAVITSSNGNIWIGMHDGGVNLLNPGKKPLTFKPVDFPKTSPVPLKAYKVLTLLEDKNGNIWIGTLTGGLIFYDVEKNELKKTDNDIKAIMTISQTADPELLVAGGDKGIETINIRTKEKKRIPIEGSSGRQFPIYVNCVFVDNFNNYWIGTEGNGVYKYDPEKNQTSAYGIKEGLPNDIIYGILSDNHGNIWISTNNGICRLETATGKVKNYNQSDGLQGNEFNYGSFFRSGSGALFFGGTNGLTYFDPAAIQKNNFIPNIDITNIEVNNAPYLRITDAISEVTLKYNENNFSIDFTALSYMYPEKNEFAYKLEGIDRDWNYVGTQRRAVYTNIPKGKYIFKVKGANSDGMWNEKGTSLKINILPAPWKTWWAYTLYMAILAAVFLYIRKLILLRIKEKREKERIEQLNGMKLSLFTDASHEFRTPLTLILGPLKNMIDKNLGDQYIQQQHATMYRNGGMLLQLINEILDFTKIDAGALSLKASESNIILFIKEVKESFDLLAQSRNIHFRFIAHEENIPVWFDKIKLKKILFNLLANAFKFTGDDKQISIKVATVVLQPDLKPVEYVEITIINFGDVLSEEQIKRIFDPFYQLDHKNKNLGSGIGLSLVKKLVELHKGAIAVKSSETEGTHFSVFLPLGNSHLPHEERVGDIAGVQDEPFFIDTAVPGGQQQIETLHAGTHASREGEEVSCLLIVEDNPDVQRFIEQIFAGQYTIFTAANGEEAMAIARQTPVDLIISDVQMPVMDGFDLCNHIKTNLETSHIFVVLLTAKTSSTHLEKGYAIGADAYITKPFDAGILKLRVDNLLKTRAHLISKFKNEGILEPSLLSISSPDEIFLRKAIALVEKNLDNPDFNANMFVTQMYMSRTVLYTKLRALTGQNISTFIRTIRLKKAGALIIQTDKTISQVAYDVGFNDLKHFRESFKEFFKVTPSDYKKLNRKNDPGPQ